MATDTGGPAYPQPAIWDEESDAVVPPGQFPYEDRLHGMTLYDWYVGQALVGLLADPATDGPKDTLAKWCHDMAGAVIAEKRRREQTEGVDK